MSVLEFVAAMTAALAWPVLLGAVVVAYRRQLRRWLADRPSRIKAGPVEAEWDVQQSRVEVALDQAAASSSTPPRSAALADRLDDLADRSPLGAVAEASRTVTSALLSHLTRADVAVDGSHGMAGLAELALAHGLISDKAANAVQGLSVMRGLAIHGGRSLSSAEAREFVALTDATLYAIGGPC